MCEYDCKRLMSHSIIAHRRRIRSSRNDNLSNSFSILRPMYCTSQNNASDPTRFYHNCIHNRRWNKRSQTTPNVSISLLDFLGRFLKHLWHQCSYRLFHSHVTGNHVGWPTDFSQGRTDYTWLRRVQTFWRLYRLSTSIMLKSLERTRWLGI